MMAWGGDINIDIIRMEFKSVLTLYYLKLWGTQPYTIKNRVRKMTYETRC